MGGQTLLIGGLHISSGTAVIWDRITELFWRIPDLRNVLPADFGERAIVALAIFAFCTGVIRCIRTAIYR